MSTADSNPEPPAPQRHYAGRAAEGYGADSQGDLYREVNRLAVLSLVAGILSPLTALMWLAVVFPVAGLILGILALRQINASPGIMTGRKMAIAGMICSGLFWLLGSGYMMFGAFNKVPVGYEAVTFPELKPNASEDELLPKKALELDDKNVYIEGFMYPGSRTVAIQRFVLVPTQKHCQYCQLDLKSTDMIQVELLGNLTANYTLHKVGVGGRLRVDHAEANKKLGGWPYKIEADHFHQ